MTGWIRNLKKVEGPAESGGPGVHYDLVISPYHAPEAVRGFETEKGTFRIEFRYIDGEEPAREIKVDEWVTAFEGKHSHRLLALELKPLAGSKPPTFGLRIEQDLQTVWDRVNQLHHHPADNLRYTRRFVQDWGQELLSGLRGGLASCIGGTVTTADRR